MLNKVALKNRLETLVTLATGREAAHLRQAYETSERRVIGIYRFSMRHRSNRPDDAPTRATQRRAGGRFGYAICSGEPNFV